MKALLRIAFTIFAIAFLAHANAATNVSVPADNQLVASSELDPDLQFLAKPHLTVNDLLTLSPKQIKQKYGVKLTLGQTVKLKMAQKKLRKMYPNGAPDEDDKVLIYVLCFLLPPLAVFLCYETEDNKFLVNIILTLLCGIPGIIHALIVCSKYFKG